MALSMTGYGSGRAAADGREVSIEMRSVNHRFLDPSFRMPRTLSFAEDALRKQMQASLLRGHVDVFVTYQNTRADAHNVVYDENLAKSYLAAAEALSAATGLANKMTVTDLMRLPDVLSENAADEDQDALLAVLSNAMAQALSGMVEMRKVEGAALAKDLIARCDTVRGIVNAISGRVPQIETEIRERFRQKLTELLGDVKFDPERMEQEVVLLVERGSITEELVRLDSHLTQMQTVLSSDENGVGRRLDFLVQEMNREINTIGSKSSDLDIANMVVRAKSEIEKIREQVQNIE